MARRGRMATTVGLILLVLVDVALVVAALRITGRSSAAEPLVLATGSPSGTPTDGLASTPTTSAAGGLSPTTSPARSGTAVPLQVLLAAVDGSVAWRGKAGTCGPGGATVSVTTDGGATWRTRTSPFPVLTRLQPTDATKAFAVGGTSTCDAGIRTTTDAGATWPGTGNLADTLARDPKDATTVRAPGSRTVAPCDGASVVDLARSSSSVAQALCADGGLRTTTDDGATWPETADEPGAVALDARVSGPEATTYLAVVKPGCAGVAVVALTAGTTSDLACVGTTAPAPGSVAISVPTPTAGWLLVGDVVWRSSGSLRTWSRAAG